MKRKHPFADGASAGVEIIDLTEPELLDAYRVYFERDRDLAGVYRLAVVVSGLLAGAAGFSAWTDRALQRHARYATWAVAGGYATAATYARFCDRSKLPRWARRHPLRTLGVCFLPLAATPVTGGGRSPLYALAAATIGSASVVYGRRTDMYVAIAAGLLWAGEAKLYTPGEGTRPSRMRRYLRIPLAFVAAARIGGELSTVAFNARSLDNLLLDLRRERERFDEWGDALATELSHSARTLIGVVERHESNEVRDSGLRALGRLFEEAGALKVAKNLRRERPREPWRTRLRRELSNRGIGEPVQDRKPWGRELKALAEACEDDWRPLLRGIDFANDVDSDLRLEDPALLAVACAAITAGIANALRHAPKLSSITINGAQTNDGRAVALTITNNGTAVPAVHNGRGAGLRTLRDEVERLQGNLKSELLPNGRYRLWIKLPLGTTPESNPELFPWRSALDRFETAVHFTEWLGFGMVAAELWPTLERDRRRSWTAAAGAALAPALGALLRKRAAPAHSPLVVAAVASAIAPGRQRGLLTGWVNINLVHHALHHDRQWTLLLAALNTAGLQISYHLELKQCLPRWWRRDSGLGPLGHQVAVTVSGIAGMVLGVLPSVGAMRQDEYDVPAEIGAVETLHDIAADFHDHHPCTEPMETIVDRSNDPATREAVGRALEAIHAVEIKRPPQRGVMKLLGDMATVIGRRISPSDVAPRVDETNLTWVPTRGFRRYAVAVADLIGREAAGGSPAGWPVRRRRVNVEFSAVHNTGTLRCVVEPVGAPTDKKRRLLEKRLLRLHADLDEWTPDGRLAVSLRQPGERSSAEPAVSTKLKTA